jgi:hypothetical protein
VAETHAGLDARPKSYSWSRLLLRTVNDTQHRLNVAGSFLSLYIIYKRQADWRMYSKKERFFKVGRKTTAVLIKSSLALDAASGSNWCEKDRIKCDSVISTGLTLIVRSQTPSITAGSPMNLLNEIAADLHNICSKLSSCDY